MQERQACTKYLKVAFAHTGPKTALFTRLRCKQWSCPACARTNAWIWRNWLLKRLPEVAGEWCIITLTANSQTREHWHSLDNIRKHLDAFFKRAKRVFGVIQYVRVYEKHPASEACHVHIVATGFDPYVAIGYSSKLQPMAIGVRTRGGRNGVWTLRTWVKKIAQELDMGYIADAQMIDGEPARAVWYVTKYLTKAQAGLHVKGLRHVQVTKGIGSPPDVDSDLLWETAAYITSRMFDAGTRISDLQTGKVIDNNHWEMHTYYPIE